MKALIARLERQRLWSQETFGPRQTAKGICAHIRKELGEIEEDPTDPTEWMDVVCLAFDGAMRFAGQPADVVAAWIAKLDHNETRDWPDWRTQDPDAAIEHVRAPSNQMTTLTPEKEAEARKAFDELDGEPHRVSSKWVEVWALPLLDSLAAERQARERAEAELAQWRSDNPPDYAEVRAAKDRIEAAEKEVERLTAENRLLQDILDSRPAINAALPDSYIRWSHAIYSGDALRALSALPPPVPTEEAEMLNDANAWYSTVQLQEGAAKYFGRGDVLLQLGDRVRVHTGEEGTIRQFLAGQTKCVHVMFGPKVGGTYFPFECEKVPTQAPQDVAGLVEVVVNDSDETVCVRLGDFVVRETGWGRNDRAETIAAEIHWAERFDAALRASPISHEAKALELAAADNNREAMVKAATLAANALEMVRDFDGFVPPLPKRLSDDQAQESQTSEDILAAVRRAAEALRCALAAFQSRQEGKAS